MNIAGAIFVNIVNLLNKRGNPIWDQRNSPQSFYKMIFFIIPALFFMSGVVVLRGQNDLNGYCFHTSETPALSISE